MNVGMGTEAVQFLFRNYMNSIFGTVRVTGVSSVTGVSRVTVILYFSSVTGVSGVTVVSRVIGVSSVTGVKRFMWRTWARAWCWPRRMA